MNPRGAALVAVLVACAALAAREAASKPSRWDAVRDPSILRAQAALDRAVDARIVRDLVPEARSVAEKLLALQAATVLDLSGGEGFRDPDTSFFLGDSLVTADHGDDERGRRLLEEALGASPESPQASRALYDIGVASARLSDFEGARGAFDAALRVEWQPEARAVLRLSRGGVAMALGDLRTAREDFTRVAESAGSTELHALGVWGLGAALSRDGDLAGALHAAAEAAGITFSDSQGNTVTVLELPQTKLVPAYDGLAYRALAAMAASERAENGEEKPLARAELDWSISLWKRYLAAARSANDRYVGSAQLALRSAESRASALGASGRLTRRGRARSR